MKDRLNKPRVFISHSKKDVAFITALSEDLRKCQIAPWLDDYEIRHGHPWLDAIFEDGIPTCDAVLVYLTEHSVGSPVVKKEIDVGILQKLKDNQIAFLPYVSSPTLRDRLRPDLQVLQTPEWNSANYAALLPRVVAEIWRSFLERTLALAVQNEKVARLQAELELQKLKAERGGAIFSGTESLDLDYIWSRLDRLAPVVLDRILVPPKPTRSIRLDNGLADPEVKKERVIASYKFDVHVGSLLLAISDAATYTYTANLVSQAVQRAAHDTLGDDAVAREGQRFHVSSYPNLGDELLMYGLLARVQRGLPAVPTGPASPMVATIRPSYVLMFTEKLERLKYWLAVNGKTPPNNGWLTRVPD
jgi:hypothetical protein